MFKVCEGVEVRNNKHASSLLRFMVPEAHVKEPSQVVRAQIRSNITVWGRSLQSQAVIVSAVS
jgi:hypothetical protein